MLDGAGYFYAPTLLARRRSGQSPAVTEEIFGPVLTLQTFDDEEEALALADHPTYGLAAGLFTTRPLPRHTGDASLQAGTVWVNRYGRSRDHILPTGGYKSSGIGKDLGREAYLRKPQIKKRPDQPLKGPPMKSYSIALIPGDGIGNDVTDAAWRCWKPSAKTRGFALAGNRVPLVLRASTRRPAAMMPADGIETLRGFDAILLGAVGWPAEVPDSVSLHGLLLPIRKAFVQYANIRPHRLLPGVEGPLRARELRHPLHPREHRGRIFGRRRARASRHAATRSPSRPSIFTRTGVERILRFGFEQARPRRRKLASVTKSNAQKYSMVFWDEVARKLAARLSGRRGDELPCRRAGRAHGHGAGEPRRGRRLQPVRRHPDRSRRGDPGRARLRRLAPTSTPTAAAPSMFEPVHGSAPDIAASGHRQPDRGDLVRRR